MANINYDELLQMYRTEGLSNRFQFHCIRKLKPITEIFCKKSKTDPFYYGELKSCLYAGYFYAFQKYDETRGAKLSSFIWTISNSRMLNFIRLNKTMQCEDVNDEVSNDIQEDNSRNELLVIKMLHDAEIEGLDFDVFVRKRGLLGYKEMSNAQIVDELGIQWSTLDTINSRNKQKLYKYKKENAE